MKASARRALNAGGARARVYVNGSARVPAKRRLRRETEEEEEAGSSVSRSLSRSLSRSRSRSLSRSLSLSAHVAAAFARLVRVNPPHQHVSTRVRMKNHRVYVIIYHLGEGRLTCRANGS